MTHVVYDWIHLLLAVAGVTIGRWLGWLGKSSRREPDLAYLIAVAAAAFPIIDQLTFTPLIAWGYLSGPIWVHRSITHSLLAGALIVGGAGTFGYWRPATIGYAAHVVPDLVFGGIKPFLPVSAVRVGVFQAVPPHYTAMSGAVALFAGSVILLDIWWRLRTVGHGHAGPSRVDDRV